MPNVYDDERESQGIGTRSSSAPDFIEPGRTYDADPETAEAENSSGDSSDQADESTANEKDAVDKDDEDEDEDGGFVKGGLDKLTGKSKAKGRLASLGGSKTKAFVGGFLVSIVLVAALAIFTFNLPANSIRAAGIGLFNTYFGATSMTNTLHLDTYMGKVVSRVRTSTSSLKSSCTGTGCVLESRLKGTKLEKYTITYKQRIVAAQAKIGYSPLTDGGVDRIGLRIDTTNEKSPHYKKGGASADELTAGLKKKGITKISVKEVSAGVFNVIDEGATKSRPSKLFSITAKESNFLPSVLTKAPAFRAVARPLGIVFRPLKVMGDIADWEKNRTRIIADWLDSRNKSITKGLAVEDIAITGKETTTDADGKVVETPTQTETTRSGFRSTFEKIQTTLETGSGKAGMTTASAALMLQGGLCMARAFYLAKDGVITDANIPTAMRLSADMMVAADESQAIAEPGFDSEGADVYVSNVLEKKNADGTVDSFASSLEYGNLNGTNAGEPLSPDASLMLGKANENTSPALQTLKSAAMGNLGETLCDGVTGLLTMGAGIALGVVSGGWSVTAMYSVAGLIAGFGVAEFGNMMAKTLNPANFSASQNYNIAGTGAAYLAASSSWSNGGSFVDSTVQKQYSDMYAQGLQQSFASQSLAYKLFNLSDTQSFASKVAVSNSTSLTANLTAMTRKLASGSLLASSFNHILGGTVYAGTSYNTCGQTMKGCVNLSSAVLNDDGTNAKAVLDGPNSQKYIDLMLECHGNIIIKDASGEWTSGGVSSMDAYFNAVTDKASDTCKTIDSDPNMVALLSYINIESAMALAVCQTAKPNSTDEIDRAACKQAGYGDTSSAPVDTPATGTPSSFSMPLKDDVAKNIRVTNCYGSGHAGIDFGIGIGAEVVAVMDGTVVDESTARTSPLVLSGNGLLLKLSDGHFVSYQHLSVKNVKVGDTVTKGQVIGLSGNTGYSTGPHLHFTVANTQTWGSKDNISLTIDPLDFLPKTGANYQCS